MTLFREGIVLYTNIQMFKELKVMVDSRRFLRAVLKENLAFKNCKISAWQKR